MISKFKNYIDSVSAKFSHDDTSEMGYRADFELLLKSIFESIKGKRIAHDSRARQGNKPDFIVLNDNIPIVYIETKNIGTSLDKIETSEQMKRYFGYENLVLTDYLEFRFYRNGLAYGQPIKIANYNLKTRTVQVIPENYELVAKTLLDFSQSHKEPIKSGNHLAKIMGGKAQRIRDNARHFLSQDSEQNMEIIKVYEAIKKMLVHDLTLEAFADMYAQTLVYGLFVARYYDESPETFTREEARDLVPASNPFLQHFFDHIVGPRFDKRLSYIVDELCAVFQHANTKTLIEDYMGDADPIIHFYEDFLREYDPELRKKMGAYYTPLPVVRFMIRSVDYILQKEFNLPDGLANTSRLLNNKHRVQILDPATGTGTFISATIRSIYERLLKQGQEGRWPTYVHNDLLPRLHGFELMMAPYTIAHLKLSLAFKQTGFWKFHRRLGIYLTNSLEQSVTQQDLLSFGFAESIADEAREADKIKSETPIMVVIGNPPYSGESSNASYTGHDVYKTEPDGGKLQERNSKWLNDDYVKFIRFAESMVEKTGDGIVAMITAHGYIDNPTFRGMRFHLMKTFDEIYVLDLHGNANKKETAPDGGVDKNVFDIKTGVSVLFCIKKKERDMSSPLAKVFHADCFGSRSVKLEYLNVNSLESIKWEKVAPTEPNYEWIVRDNVAKEEYRKGFSVAEMFLVSSVGIVTSRDDFIIDMDKSVLEHRLRDFLSCRSSQEAKSKFNLKENKTWKVTQALNHVCDEDKIVPISYRPFDVRYIYYDNDFIERSRVNVMKNFVVGKNIGLVTARSNKNPGIDHFFVSTKITEAKLGESSTQSAVFPLYLYSEEGSVVPNLKKGIIDAIEKNVGNINPQDVFDYIYAVLHSPNYRKKYKEFLKIDFPRIPYPEDGKYFNKMASFGAELRTIHLLESPLVNRFITTYPVPGSDTIDKIIYKDGKVFINSEQYFGNVPEVAWNFYIGGYQPAQKWLKDRKDRLLTNEDIEHYQKIIVSLFETDRIMKEIDKT